MQRLDLLLTERGLCRSRSQAQQIIADERVSYRIDNHWKTTTKPGLKLSEETELHITPGGADHFVSRGALKLLDALEYCPIPIKGAIALDIGQSTGGFTDCLLQQGATRVIGIEVGHDQLAQKLRQDPRVICYEGSNARNLDKDELLQHTAGNGFDLVVMDVSFISQTLILPGLPPLLKPGGVLISLVKPQFEVGPEGVGKGGIVRDNSLYNEVQDKIIQCCEAHGLEPFAYRESPIQGADGNHEFLLLARRPAQEEES
ncbi:TlyA family RNA methyltransferase [Nitrincola sp. MINF-07-Sa-05]|uniref:TlyA family RNA methyltransferase n=1 Tax=Nitrincola salilacus TaxID=3400273 RepID=UPI00391845F0